MRRSALIASVVSICGLVAAVGVTAPVAQAAPGVISVAYYNGLPWPALPNGPVNVYGGTNLLLASSTTGELVKLSVSGGCAVTLVDSNRPTTVEAKLTGTSGVDDCLLTVASPAGKGLDASSITYTLRAVASTQSAQYGKVMDTNTISLKKTYVLGKYPLKTAQGQKVSFVIKTGSKYCSVKLDKSKGWLLKVGSKKGKCSAAAVAAGVPPNYAPLDREQFWSAY